MVLYDHFLFKTRKMKYKTLLLSMFFVLPALAQNDLQSNVERFVNYEIDFDKHPGIIIGIIENDNELIIPFGETQKGNGIQPTAKTHFELGSLTKVFTATLIQQLITEGRVSYEDNIAKYVTIENLESKNITIKDLMQHTSGLPRYPFGFGEGDKNQPYNNYSKKQLIKFLETYNIPQKREYIYSHINSVLLGYVIEAASGKDYYTYLKETILDPLGMNDTFLVRNETFVANAAQGYDKFGNEVPHWEVQTFDAAVGLISTMADLMKFLTAQFYNRSPISTYCLPLHEPQVKTNFKKIKGGLGWHIMYPYKKYHGVIGHSGATNGHQVYMAFVQETQTGIVLLTNSTADHKDLGYFILKMMNFNWNRDTADQAWKY